MENLIKDLEELTQRMPWGTVERGETGFYVNGLDVPCYMPYGIESIVRAISELKKYEELKKKISDGRLVELPCKVGDKVYSINKTWLTGELYIDDRFIITAISISKNKIDLFIGIEGSKIEDGFPFVKGRDFFTKEAAEAKLLEFREGGAKNDKH